MQLSRGCICGLRRYFGESGLSNGCVGVFFSGGGGGRVGWLGRRAWGGGGGQRPRHLQGHALLLGHPEDDFSGDAVKVLDVVKATSRQEGL